MEQYLTKRMVYLVIGLIALFVFLKMGFGINDMGHRTVVQYPNGTVYVKFSPGFYTQWFGSIETYKDVITFDFDKEMGIEDPTMDQHGIAVRYQDGGTGTIFGKARFSLPADEPTMLSLHRDFRSNTGVAQKLIRTVTEEAMNLTAGLMTSEEAYAEKRGIYTQWAQEQIAGGKFQTGLKEVMGLEEGTGQRVVRNVPVIKTGADGLSLHLPSDLKIYGFSVVGPQITDWDFEPKTLEQIQTKRQATMAIITAKANAERARQDAMTAEQQGLANVVAAKYEEEVLKIKAVVQAQREKEVRVIAAEQKVVVAEQTKLEAEQLKLAAVQYKQEQTLRGEGDGAYKKLVMEADGALALKTQVWKEVNFRYAEAIEKQRWVPEIQMGSNGTSGGSAATGLVELLTAQTAKQLKLDMEMQGQSTSNK